MYMHVASDMHPRVHCLRPYYAPLDEQVGMQKNFSALCADINFIAPPLKIYFLRHCHIQSLRTSGVTVGEDIILAMAEVIHRDIYAYVAFTELLVNKPINELTEGKLITIAFFF